MHGYLEKIAKEVESAEELLNSTIRDAAEGVDEARVWLVYLKVEKNVALLKLYLSVENPGRFVTIEKKVSDKVRLASASREIARSRALFAEGKLSDSLEALRSARNDLRGYLQDKRSERLKAARRPRPPS